MELHEFETMLAEILDNADMFASRVCTKLNDYYGTAKLDYQVDDVVISTGYSSPVHIQFRVEMGNDYPDDLYGLSYELSDFLTPPSQ